MKVKNNENSYAFNKNYPPFSVLISVYKNEKPEYLDLALVSVENQTIKPKEIVLVEDGPISKELKHVILKHKACFGDGFKDIAFSQNRGLGFALRLGTNYVSTEWIARMDSDDYSLPFRFEKQMKVVKEKPNIAVVGGQICEFAENIRNIRGFRRVPTSNEKIRKFIKWRSPFNHPTVLINKKALQKVGGYLPYGNLEDYYLWSRIISNGYSVCNLDEIITCMRVDDGLYKRRGNLSNIRYMYLLRSYLHEHGLLRWYEKIIGDWIMTVNILIPSGMRKILYQHVLHRR